jgi:hypothetical protein
MSEQEPVSKAPKVRAAWRALLFAAVYIAASSLAEWAFALLEGPANPGPLPPSRVVLQQAPDILALGFALLLMKQIDRRHVSIADFGYRDARKARRCAWGAAIGFLSISTMVGVLWTMHLLVFNATATPGRALPDAIVWALIALGTGLFEESLLRGYLQYTLADGFGFRPAAVVLSLVFALWHIPNSGESPFGLLVVGLGGLVFCLSLWYTKSLWWGIGFHAGWDWGQSYFYGTPDSGIVTLGHLFSTKPAGNPIFSGGATGPEGSLFMLPLLAFLALAMWAWWGRRKSAESPELC